MPTAVLPVLPRVSDLIETSQVVSEKRGGDNLTIVRAFNCEQCEVTCQL